MRNIRKLTVFTILLAACGSAIGADLRVEINNADPSSGRVYFALFDSAAEYDAFQMHARARSEKDSEVPHAVFPDLAAGEYGVAVFQDTNGNLKLDTDEWGIPAEPYGFSRNAEAERGRPDFEATAIQLPAGDETLTVEIALTSRN